MQKNRDKTREYCKRDYEKNKEARIARTSEYKKENPDKNKVWADNYRNNHKEKLNAKSRRYNSENKEKLREINARFREKNRESLNNRERRRRATKFNLPGSHTSDDIAVLLENQAGKCNYCSGNIRGKYSVDHIIPITREGSSDSIENIQLLCKSCNSSKHNKTHDEYVVWLEKKQFNEIKEILQHWRL